VISTRGKQKNKKRKKEKEKKGEKIGGGKLGKNVY